MHVDLASCHALEILSVWQWCWRWSQELCFRITHGICLINQAALGTCFGHSARFAWTCPLWNWMPEVWLASRKVSISALNLVIAWRCLCFVTDCLIFVCEPSIDIKNEGKYMNLLSVRVRRINPVHWDYTHHRSFHRVLLCYPWRRCHFDFLLSFMNLLNLGSSETPHITHDAF